MMVAAVLVHVAKDNVTIYELLPSNRENTVIGKMSGFKYVSLCLRLT